MSHRDSGSIVVGVDEWLGNLFSEENGARNGFSYLLLLFSGGARRYKTSRPVFLELCELKNNSDAGAKGKATGLLRLTRLQAD